MFKNAEEVLQFIKDEDIKFVDIRFTDLPGVQQHFNVPAKTVDLDFFVNGQLFDGSSIRGFQGIAESDMQLIPDPKTAFVDTFRLEKTLALNFSIVNPRTGDPYHRDPRGVAEKAEAYLESTGIADTAFFGAEAEFFVFDNVQYESSAKGSFYKIDSEEAYWNTGRKEEGGNLGYKTPQKGGYFPVAPVDHQADLRDAMCLELDAAGLEVERSHHEVGAAGQAEINYKFNTLVHAADDLQKFKYVIKNTAWAWGKSVTFMPKPVFGDNGSGMHCHQSLWTNGDPLFYDEKGYAGLSDMARWYIGGLLKHADAVLAFSAQLMAGLDGIKNRIEPPAPIDKDLYELPPEEAKDIPKAPESLEEALIALENDNEFLQAGGVFTQDLIDTWIDYKRENEIKPLQLRPNPYEFELYYGC